VSAPTPQFRLGHQHGRLGRHSLVYGLGGLVSRIVAVLLLPVYTHFLTPADYGKIETIVALTTLLGIVLRAGISSAFFRFYFDADDDASRRTVLRTSFWFTMGGGTLGLLLLLALADPISDVLFGTDSAANLVRAAGVALWATVNYEQLTSLFRVEERSLAFVGASLANVFLTIGVTLLLVVELDKGAVGVIVGNFSGTLLVYLALLGFRREQLGLELNRDLLRAMNRFGIPLVPTALFLWVTNFSDRFFLVKLSDVAQAGLYSVGVRVASAMVLLLTAFRMAWPAFAYSIREDEHAKRTYAFVLTYMTVVSSWVALVLTLLAPWLVRLLAAPRFAEASRVVGPLAFASVAFGAYIVIAIGVGRIRRTQFNWVVTGVSAAVNVVLNLTLIPPYGMMGAAVATVAAYVTMALGMAWWSQRVYPVPYQWRRVATAALAAVALAAGGKALDVGLAGAFVLCALYPLALAVLGFTSREERRRLGRLVAR
jgi:O-antigen/teichoic acid export membrane protein